MTEQKARSSSQWGMSRTRRSARLTGVVLASCSLCLVCAHTAALKAHCTSASPCARRQPAGGQPEGGAATAERASAPHRRLPAAHAQLHRRDRIVAPRAARWVSIYTHTRFSSGQAQIENKGSRTTSVERLVCWHWPVPERWCDVQCVQDVRLRIPACAQASTRRASRSTQPRRR